MTDARAVIITGAKGGIGRILCGAFSAAGYAVVATDLDIGPDDLTCNVYESCDLGSFVTEPEVRQDLLDRLSRETKGLRIKALINNAAIQRLGAFESLAVEDWRHSLDVNLLAPALLTQGLLPPLVRAHGCVVNIASIHARLTKPGFAAYSVSKAALVGLTRAMSVELSGRIRVNAISPAAIETDMLKAGFKDDPSAFGALAASHPAMRIGHPQEVAAAALFLAGDDCPFLTGAILELAGGIGSRLHDPL